MPHLSVIVIGRNEATRIGQCLRSVFRALEEVRDYEVIYVDSASEDDTVNIASEFPIRVLQLQREWRLTPSAGRYIGYQHAGGEYLAFVDGDTVLHPDWLRESCAFLRANPEVGGVAGVVEKDFLDDADESAAIGLGQKRKEPHGRVQKASKLGGIATYRREAMEKAGTFNPFLPTGEECEIALRIRRAGYTLVRLSSPMCLTHTLPPESIREIMRRSRAHLYDYGATLRYCLKNGCGLRFSIEQMWFIYTYVAAGVALLAAAAIGLLTGSTWIVVIAAVIAGLYAALARKQGKHLGISFLKRTMMTYRTILSFLMTKPVPIDSYPRDVVVVK